MSDEETHVLLHGDMEAETCTKRKGSPVGDGEGKSKKKQTRHQPALNPSNLITKMRMRMRKSKLPGGRRVERTKIRRNARRKKAVRKKTTPLMSHRLPRQRQPSLPSSLRSTITKLR